jgi:hypothetical protein
VIQHEFVRLLEEGRSEALAILAWYFAAIHLVAPGIWLFGDAGNHLFRLAKEYLGPDWAAVLEKPAQIMKEFDRQRAREEEEHSTSDHDKNSTSQSMSLPGETKAPTTQSHMITALLSGGPGPAGVFGS